MDKKGERGEGEMIWQRGRRGEIGSKGKRKGRRGEERGGECEGVQDSCNDWTRYNAMISIGLNIWNKEKKKEKERNRKNECQK